ncbi:MAG: PAS domain S-box protein [Chitinophagaceae bacterium]|nr:MAG: PAS domain S-box protein [Chitinophagaceae bacterium]
MIKARFKNYVLNNNMKWAYIAALLCVGSLIWATFNNLHQTNHESNRVKTSLSRLLRLENILVNVKSIESGQRGFVLSGDESYLGSYYKGITGIGKDTSVLKEFMPGKYNETAIQSRLLRHIGAKIKHSDNTIAVFRRYGMDSVQHIVDSKVGIVLMDSINRLVFELETNDRATLHASNNSAQKLARATTIQLSLLAGLFLLILFVAYLITNRDFKKIIDSEKKLKFNASLIRNISDPIITTNMDDVITNWNIYAEELYGYKEKEAIGKNVYDILRISEEHKKLESRELQEKGNDYWKGDSIHFHRNGDTIYVEVTVSSIKDESGDNVGFVSVIRDISKRKLAEEQLNELKNNLEEEVKVKSAELNNVFSRITDAFIAFDNNWNYTYLNKQAAELHGRSAEELIGKNVWDEYPLVMNEPFFDALQTAKKTGEPQRVQLYYSEIKTWYEDLIYPSADGISVYYHDITIRKQAELALQIAHEKLNYHINNTPMGVVEFDVNKKVKTWSHRAEEIFGWSETEMKEKSDALQTLVHENDISQVQESIDGLSSRESNKGIMQLRNYTKDKQVIYCNWYNSVLKDNEGNIIGIMSLVQDVTEKTKIEQELKEAEEKFRNLVEQSMVGVYIMQDTKCTYANPRLQEITGYSVEELMNMDSILDIIHVDDQEKVMNNFRERYSGNTTSLNYQFRGRKKNGQLIYVEVFGSVTQFRGKPAIIGTLIDVTDKYFATQAIEESKTALQKSNERFELVSKATNDSIWDWDLQGQTIWGNEAFRTLFDADADSEFGMEDFAARIHPDDRDRILMLLHDSFKQGQTFIKAEFKFLLANSTQYIIVDDKAHILYDDKGKAVRLLGALRDITRQKMNEERIILEKDLSDTIINSLPGVFYLYNKEGKFFRWNKNLELFTGHTSEELAHLSPLDLISPEDRSLVAQKIWNVFELGRDFVESSLISKTGKKTPFYFTGQVIQYEGETCLMGVGIDISDRLESQQQLAQSEERYRTLIEQASDGIFISNKEGLYLDVNSNGIKMTGYSKEELLSLTIYDLMAPGEEENNPVKLEELLSGKVVINERKLKRKDGELINVEISAKLLVDGRFLGMVRDISARKIVEEALRLSEEKYRLLFYKNPMPMMMISMPERDFLDVNDAALAFYGYTKDEFLTMNVMDIRPEEEKGKLKNMLAEDKRGINYAGIWKHVKKDGSIVNVNIISHDISYEGRPARLVLADDVTEQMLAEESVRQSHEAYRQLASHVETIREAERTHIAREIHDELGQQLTGLKMDISWLSRKIKSEDKEVQGKITETIELIDGTVKTVRRIATELRPSILDDLGLVAAMEWQSEEFERRSGINTRFESNIAAVDVNTDMATGVFRIYQESLTNVMRHADATSVEASLIIKDDEIKLVIADDGKGFVVEEIANKKTLGLMGMRERATLMGGTYEISSMPQKGTAVIIVVPFKKI